MTTTTTPEPSPAPTASTALATYLDQQTAELLNLLAGVGFRRDGLVVQADDTGTNVTVSAAGYRLVYPDGRAPFGGIGHLMIPGDTAVGSVAYLAQLLHIAIYSAWDGQPADQPVKVSEARIPDTPWCETCPRGDVRLAVNRVTVLGRDGKPTALIPPMVLCAQHTREQQATSAIGMDVGIRVEPLDAASRRDDPRSR